VVLMLRRIASVLGLLLIVVGGIFLGHGGGLIGGSFMTGCSQTVSMALIPGVPAELP
jgi:hypothetical protein